MHLGFLFSFVIHCTKKADLFPMLDFLGEKENSLKTDDYGRDLSSVQTLLTKQVSRGPCRPDWDVCG